jgi:plasmid stability protein
MIAFLAVPQLLVRDIESAVVKKLRRRAATAGISVEEAHRQLLRSALTGNQPGPQNDFLAYLRKIPNGDPIDFPRSKDRPRRNEF